MYIIMYTLCLFLIVIHSSNGISEHSVDFVIVGGGIGGCTVASRLSENGKYSVLILESGDFPDPKWDIPVTSSSLLGQPHENVYIYTSEQQENAGLSYDGYLKHYMGRGLGGGSMVNGMIFNRGSPYDFNNWAQIVQDDGWNYANMLPYFKKVEDYHGEWPSTQHGYGGRITVSRPTWDAGVKRFLNAGNSFGYSIEDPNGPQKISFTPIEFSIKKGKRVSAYTSYIQPFLKNRPNLEVLVNAQVMQVLFEGNKAVGVIYTKNGTETKYIAKSNKEVILSAGFAETPALLMRSGIGPKPILTQAGIQIIKELPVGQNLQDHLALRLYIIINSSSEIFQSKDLTPEAFQLWNETGDGPYSTWSGQSSQAFFVSTVGQKRNPNWSDIHMMSFNSPGIAGFNFPPQFQLTPGEVLNTVGVCVSRPKSRGFVSLNVTHVESRPLLDFRYLSEAQDVETILEGVKMTLEMYENTKEYQEIGARLPAEPLESCQQFLFRSDDYWRCVIRHTAKSWSHGCCTSKMGKGSEDPMTVVDAKLRVIGVQGLRIVDASVMPIITNANLQAVVYAIAEKAVDIILKDLQL